ncbi:hypothetical protein [Actinoplanes sp. NPDC026670]|uniref:hypothetical protein n=1 Tax=Actinoplanes sp. NPDC026670 TaxID=3154700 RepID=UPI0033C46DB6
MSLRDLAEIAFEIPGWPPIKNEALSLFSAGNKQFERVRSLLEAAAEASRQTGWTVISGDICLAVVVRAPSGRPPGDATNYLGGIGDVLQDKSKPVNLDLSHLGPLQAVALYENDQQIQRVRYDVETADVPSYTVKVSALPGVQQLTAADPT